MSHVVCYSGGHSSALVAVEVVRRFGPGDVILLNHDINPLVEDSDIKRFKREVAEHLGLPITYANHPDIESKDQFGVVVDAKAFKVGNGGVTRECFVERLVEFDEEEPDGFERAHR